MWKSILAVSLGAALGALLRWVLGLKLNTLLPSMPPGTVVANDLWALLLAGTGLAGAQPAPTRAEQMACRSDAQKLCASFIGQPQPMNASSATQALARHFDRLKGADGNVGTRELLLAAGNANSPPDLRNAAMFALKHPGLLGALDRADATVRGNVGEMADGRVSKGDITAALQKTAPVAGERQVLQTLKDHPEAFKGGDGLLDRAELGRIVTTGKLPNGQQASDDVRVAARFLLGRPEVFDKVDDAHLVQNNKGQGPRGDGKISLKDVETALKGQPTVQPQVLALQALAARAA